MAKRIILDDCNGNEIEVSLLDGLCLIKVGHDFDEDYYNGSVLFDKEDIDELIKVLEEIKKQL
jgi:hypothetical protein